MTLATAATAFAATPSATSDVALRTVQVQPRSVKVTAADMVDKVGSRAVFLANIFLYPQDGAEGGI